MCSPTCLKFATTHLTRTEVESKNVIEIGARNVNGSVRELAMSFQPAKYVGVDIMHGPGVDELCDIGDLVHTYGEASYDVVVCTEIMEHVRRWRKAVSNIKHILKPEGVVVLTTRSYGFRHHGFPYDFWRYEVEDMRALFSDFEIEAVASDPMSPGVFLKARKPTGFLENDLERHELYSIITRKRVPDIREFDLLRFKLVWPLRRLLLILLPARLKKAVRTLLNKGK